MVSWFLFRNLFGVIFHTKHLYKPPMNIFGWFIFSKVWLFHLACTDFSWCFPTKNLFEANCLKGDSPPCTLQAGAPFCTRPCMINATLNFGIVDASLAVLFSSWRDFWGGYRFGDHRPANPKMKGLEDLRRRWIFSKGILSSRGNFWGSRVWATVVKLRS